MAPRIHVKLALVWTIGVLVSVTAAPQPKPQSKTETTYSSSSSSSSSSLTAPAILTPTSSENVRFSRLLRDNSEGLRFTSLSNVAPELARAISKESKEKISNAIPGNTVKFGRRVLDYNDDSEVDESALKIITRPEPGNEYVYIQPPGISTAQARSVEDVSGGDTLTAINKKAINHRIPVALLRQTMGNRVNINPVFPNLSFDEEPVTGERQNSFNQIPNDPQENANFEVTTVAPHFYNEEYEATTIPAISPPEVEEVVVPVVTTTEKVHKRKKMVVNIITSGPRVVFDNTTSVAASTTTTEAPKSSTATSASKADDEKENLLVQASSNRVKTFPDFEDSPTRLQTAESSSQPARVNVRPASSGKDYEYEYIYYYYDDDDDSENGTSKRTTTAATIPEDIVTKIPATATTTYATTTSTTTTTTTPAPVFESYEEEDEEEIEEKPVSPKSAAPLKNSFASSPPASSGHKQYITEKVTASNPSNLLEKSRGQKTFPSSVAEAPEAAATRQVEQDISNEQDDEDYEDAHDEPKREILSSSLRGQNQGREPTSESPSTVRDSTTVNAHQATSGIYDNMQKLPKPHPTSVNTPIVLKQSSLIRVPASQLPGAIEDDYDASPATPATTTTTTTTPEPEVTSRAPHKFRAQTIRLRGNSAGTGGNTISRAIPTAPAENAVEKQEAPVRSRAPSVTYKEATRIVSRRPHVSKPVQEAPQTSPSIAVQNEEVAPAPRPIVSRTRFPLRTTAASPVVETAAPVTTPDASYQQISSEVSSAAPVDANSVNDRKAKENFVRNKSANDLFAFTRLQQAIHSRQPSRNKELQNYNKATAPKVGGFLSSQEQTTDTPDSSASSEYTTAAPYVSGSSAESSQVVTELPAATTTTTTTTTTEAVQLDRFGKPKRFPGRTRRPPSAVGGVATTTTTEAPKPSGAQIAGGNRSGFNGRRRKFGTTPAPSADVHENVVSSSASSPSSESAPAPVSRVTPSRSRFASRNRGAATTETSPDTQNKEESTGEQSTTAPVTPRRRQQSHFAGRKRLNKATQATNEQESESSQATSPAPTIVPAAPAAPAAPKPEGEHQRNRFNYGSNGRATRPAGPGPRIRSQRLGGSTTTTTEAPAAAEQVAEVAAENHETAEQVSAGEQTDAAPSTTAAPEPPKRGSAGVLGRLRNRSKPATTTTAAPEPVQERKPQRGGGLLNRRKQATAPTTTTAAPAVEEEEGSNNAQEQLESQHKGVVVQISSSVSEGEEVQEQAEESEPSSTTAASILNRLKIQRKPGSIYRKRPEPQGE